MKQILNKLAATTPALALLISPLIALIPAQPAQAAFPGLNGRITLASTSDGNNEIYSYKIDGSDPRRLTNNPATDFSSNYSPDGTKIVFVSERDGNREIYTMNADGTNQTRITNNSVVDQQPGWSPDGTKIVYNSQSAGSQDIWIMNSDGTDPVQVTNIAGQTEQTPHWSPDGTKILYRSNEGGVWHYYTIYPDGTNKVVFLNTSAADNTVPRWSPDGTKIVFNSTRDGNNEIHTMNADGSNALNLSNNPSSDTFPRWTPEGKIIFSSDRSGTVLVYAMNADGSDVTVFSDFNGDVQPLTIPPTTIDSSITLNATEGPVIYNAPVNHTDTYESIDPTSVTITTQPQKGSISVNATTGEITYTPNHQASTRSLLASLDNFFFPSAYAQESNQDSFAYQICSTANSQLCTEATVTVNLAGAALGSLASTGSNTTLFGAVAVLAIAGSVWWMRRQQRRLGQ